MTRPPFFRIGAHVFYYGVGFSLSIGPIMAYAYYFGQTEEEKIEMLKAKVSARNISYRYLLPSSHPSDLLVTLPVLVSRGLQEKYGEAQGTASLL
jgi:hypothetical protein